MGISMFIDMWMLWPCIDKWLCGSGRFVFFNSWEKQWFVCKVETNFCFFF